MNKKILEIIEKIKNNQIGEKLDLSVEDIDDEGAKSISEALKINSSLKVLSLNSLIYFLL
jgi:hypothetical protein